MTKGNGRRKPKPKGKYVPFDYGRHKDEWGSLYWPLALCWMAAGVALTAAAISVVMVVWAVLT
jgi:hypothetical protein